MPPQQATYERRNRGLNFSNTLAKEGDNVTVVLTAQERHWLSSVTAFAAEFPHFLMEIEPEQKDQADAFISGIVAKMHQAE